MRGRTELENQQLIEIAQRITALKALLERDEVLAPEHSAADWYKFLEDLKLVQGNTSNGMSFVACLLAKEFLTSCLSMADFDVASKPQGAPGLDIDEMTLDGQRVVGEIKTTKPYKNDDLGSAQKASFQKDFVKLREAEAAHKFFFLTHADTFRVVRERYSQHLSGVTVVLLTTGERWAP